MSRIKITIFPNEIHFAHARFPNNHQTLQVSQERKGSVYFASYESLKKDPKSEVAKIAKFLESDLSANDIDAIVELSSFNSMRNEDANYSEAREAGIMDFNVSKFMRKGQVGDWKNHFTVNQNKAFDEMYQARTKDWTLNLEFEI